jgi:DNA-binding GntR family transcriptional regulator
MLGEFGVQERLAEERLGAMLNVSRTPVREALLRLLGEGLVLRTQDGYFAALPDVLQLRDLYELRITLELRSLTRVMESETLSHDAALLEPLRDNWRQMRVDKPDPDPQFVVLDEDFHVTLSRASGNPSLTETLLGVNARIRPVRMYDFLTEDRIDLTIRQHLQILEHVLAGRLDKALRSMRGHVGESMEVVERRAQRATTHMAMNRGVR